MQKKIFVLSVFATLAFSSSFLSAEAKITAFYDRNPAEQKLQVRCIAKGLESGKEYIVAVGAGSAITAKGSVEVPEGSKIEAEAKSYVEKDIARINPAIKELKAEGYRLTVHQVSPESEVRYLFDISLADMEKLKQGNNPLYLYISREFAPNVFYIVDYYEMAPATLVGGSDK
ncbi:MAG: hypothetical protein HYX74_08415 [Acidobacteria bacterium]|nr:hypothetical protein [Acidobacteriota bacterium]